MNTKYKHPMRADRLILPGVVLFITALVLFGLGR
jgi:hypothetical protein